MAAIVIPTKKRHLTTPEETGHECRVCGKLFKKTYDSKLHMNAHDHNRAKAHNRLLDHQQQFPSEGLAISSDLIATTEAVVVDDKRSSKDVVYLAEDYNLARLNKHFPERVGEASTVLGNHPLMDTPSQRNRLGRYGSMQLPIQDRTLQYEQQAQEQQQAQQQSQQQHALPQLQFPMQLRASEPVLDQPQGAPQWSTAVQPQTPLDQVPQSMEALPQTRYQAAQQLQYRQQMQIPRMQSKVQQPSSSSESYSTSNMPSSYRAQPQQITLSSPQAQEEETLVHERITPQPYPSDNHGRAPTNIMKSMRRARAVRNEAESDQRQGEEEQRQAIEDKNIVEISVDVRLSINPMANLMSNGLPYMSLPLQNLPNLPTEIPLKVRPLSSSDNGWSTVEYQRQALGGPYQDGALSYPEQTLHGRMFSDSSDSSQDPRVGKQQLLQITEQGQQGNPQFQTNQERFRPSDELMRRTRMHSNPNTIKSNETHNIAAPASYAQIQANSAAKIPSPQSTTRHSAPILNAGSPPNFYSPLAYDYDGHEVRLINSHLTSRTLQLPKLVLA